MAVEPSLILWGSVLLGYIDSLFLFLSWSFGFFLEGWVRILVSIDLSLGVCLEVWRTAYGVVDFPSRSCDLVGWLVWSSCRRGCYRHRRGVDRGVWVENVFSCGRLGTVYFRTDSRIHHEKFLQRKKNESCALSTSLTHPSLSSTMIFREKISIPAPFAYTTSPMRG